MSSPEPKGVLMSTEDKVLQNEVQQYLALKEEIEFLSKRQSEIKSRLMDAVEADGEVDGKGHKVIEVGDVKLVKQRKVSKSLDMATAENILATHNLTEKCVEMVPRLNEDAIMAAFYQELLTEEEIDAMFPSKVSYAFLVNK